MPNCPSVTVSANVIKAVPDAKFGLTVELQTSTDPVIFEPMDKGSMQINLAVWLPNQQGFVNQYKAKVELNNHGAPAVPGIRANKAAADSGFGDTSDLAGPTKAALLDRDGNGTAELKRFAFNLKQIEGKARQAERRECCVLHLIC